MKKPHLYIIVYILMLNTIVFAQVSKRQVAVLRLDPVGVTEGESITLTNRLRSELVKTDAFTILERDKMDEILKEQGFQMTGCTSSECAVEAGQLLNVQEICSGSIGKIGSIYTVVVRLIDVQTGKILKTVTEDCECPLERVLTNSMHNIALKLAGKMPNTGGVRVLEKGHGDIYIKTDPPGAEVYFDDIKLEKVTPMTLRKVAAGRHKIEVVKGDLVGSRTITIKDNELYREEIKLLKAKGSLKIFSDPPEADITLDGNNYGKTPRLLQEVGSGSYSLIISKTGYMPFKKEVRILPGKVETVDVHLKKMALLSLSSEPGGAAININGVSRGRTPALIYVPPDIDLTIRLAKKGFEEAAKNISLQQGAYKKINIKLDESIGAVIVDVKPKDAQISIGSRIYKSGQLIKLPSGEYEAKIKRAGFLNKKVRFEIEYARNKKLRIILTQKSLSGAFKRSFVPGWGQFYQDKTVRGWIYPIAVLACGVGSYIYFDKYNKAVDDHNWAKEQYKNAFDEQDIKYYRNLMDETYDTALKMKNIRNTFYIATAAAYLWNIADVLLLPPKWDRKVSLGVGVNGRFYSVRATIQLP